MNRRQFLSTPEAPPSFRPPRSRALAQAAAPAPARQQVSLNGTWERYVAGKLTGTVEAPSSLRPSGHYRLKREFVLPKLPARAARRACASRRSNATGACS